MGLYAALMMGMMKYCFTAIYKVPEELMKWMGGGEGHIVGISIAVPEGGKWYFPIRHEVESEDNLPGKGFGLVKKNFRKPKATKNRG